MWAVRMSGCQGTPSGEELDGKEIHGALGGKCDLEPRGPAVSCTWSTRNQPIFHDLQVRYNADFKGWCFDGFLVLLYYFIGVLYMALSLSSRTVLSYIRIRFASPNPRTALLLQRVLSRGLSPRTRAASYPQRAFELGRVSSLKTARTTVVQSEIVALLRSDYQNKIYCLEK